MPENLHLELVARAVPNQATVVVRPVAQDLSWPGEIGPVEARPSPVPNLLASITPDHPKPASHGFQNDARLVFLFPGPVVALGETRVQGFQLAPPVSGHWWWRSPSILMFEPDAPMAAGTYCLVGHGRRLAVNVRA